MDALAAQLDAFTKEWNNPNANIQSLSEKMVALRVAASTTPATDSRGLLVQREILEHAVLLQLRRGDLPAMDRAMSALRVLYIDHSKELPPSPRAQTLLGVHLLFLLTENRLADLHAALELMDDETRNSRYVRFVVALEQHKMEGRYHKLWEMQRHDIPHELFAPLMATLLNTVRADISASLEDSYTSLPLQHARTLLSLDSANEMIAFAEQRGWRIVGDNVVLKELAQEEAPKLNAVKLIAQTLAYANELERII